MEKNKSVLLSDTSMVVDLTTADDDADDDIIAVHRKEKKEVPMYIISEEEWLNCLPEKEKEYHEKHLITSNEIEQTTITCTACFKQPNHKKLGEIYRHPSLNVPVCKNCANFYFDGAWTKDEEGSFEYCGWCAQGGELYLCGTETCPNAFCTRCIKRNLGRSFLAEITKQDDWKCFECKPRQIRQQRLLYFSLHKYWQSLTVKEEKHIRRHKKSRIKVKNKNKKVANSIQPVCIDADSSETSGCDEKNSHNKCDKSKVENVSASILQCLKFAEEVSDIFKGGIKSEKEKLQNLKTEVPENIQPESAVWKHAKRVAKMVALQNKNLALLVDLVADQVSKDCPNHDVEELKRIAKVGPSTSEISSASYKDETSKAGLEKTFDNTKDCTNEVETKENRSLDAPATEPVAGPSGIVRLKLRKDLFEEPNVVDIVVSKKIGNNPNTPNYNRSHPSNSSLIENDSKCGTPADKESGGTSKVVNVPPPHDECNDYQLREVVVPSPPVPRTSTEKTESNSNKSNLLRTLTESPIHGSCSLNVEKSPANVDEIPASNQGATSPDIFDKSTSDAEKISISDANKIPKSCDKSGLPALVQLAQQKQLEKSLCDNPVILRQLERPNIRINSSTSSSSETSNEKDSDCSISSVNKHKKLKKKKEHNFNKQASSSSDKEDVEKCKNIRKTKKGKSRTLFTDEVTNARAAVLASTSEDDIANDKNECTTECHNMQTLTENDDLETKQTSKTLNLSKVVSVIDNSNDIYDDIKLKQRMNVQLFPLSAGRLSEIDHRGKKFVGGQNIQIGTMVQAKSRIVPLGSHPDCEIDRLCNLESIEKTNFKNNKVDDAQDTTTPKQTNLKSQDKNTKKSHDTRCQESADMCSEEEKAGENSDSDKLHNISNLDEIENTYKISATDVAKLAVLETSSSDENREFEGNKDKIIPNQKTNETVPDGSKLLQKEHKNKPITKVKKPEPAFFTMKLSESEISGESEDKQKAERRQKKLHVERKVAKQKRRIMSSDEELNDENGLGNAGHLQNTDSSDNESSWSSDEEESKNKNHALKKRKNIDGDKRDSDVTFKKKNRRKKMAHDSTDSSTEYLSDDESKPKRKRQRIKNEFSSDKEKEDDDKDSPHKRKNIRKIVADKKLSEDTKIAALDEKERKKRMDEKQKLYNELFETKDGGKVDELPLDFDEKTKEVLVQVDPYLLKRMKPHQSRGIKFMWDAVFESKQDFLKNKIPGGAILAHCMGLGKTLQTIGLLHSVMKTFPGKMRCILVLAPVNTLKNWVDEFDKWLRGPLLDDIEVYEISGEKDYQDRADYLEMWKQEGGVMIMGYDMFRNLTRENNKKFRKKQKEVFKDTLIAPGPQMVVCDEGHILKNTKAAINAAMNRISTRRRIILTGTPLQNNLSEYFAMVDFVKPKLLGTFKEFKNRFVNPIQNGQHSDSTDRDVRIMKKRSFILSDTLKGCMQRLDYNVLMPYLQPKHEYVLCICLTEFQKTLYTFYLEKYAQAGQIGAEGKLEGGKKGGLFYDVQNLSRIWNHPYILLMAKHRSDEKKMLDDDEEDLKYYFVDGSEEEQAKPTSENDMSDNSEHPPPAPRAATRSIANTGELVKGLDEVKRDFLAADKGWWNKFLDLESGEPPDLQLKKLSLGPKMILLMDILKEAETVGDKVLVFSQSLLSLDIIQEFLRTIDESNNKGGYGAGDMENYLGSWQEGRDYYRMDGSTSPDVRKKWCNYFNKVSNHRMRLFLISTRAGGLGINLVAANRVIIFDASWNPAHDVQSIFRVYRFGQEKPVYIYRFLAKGTMEEKIYDRQVTKQSLSARVVDEQQIERHFSMNELAELYTYNDEKNETRPVPKVPKDLLLAELLKKHGSMIWSFHDHDSLLENQVDENLTEEERKAAWEEFENEKKGIPSFAEVGQLNTNLLLSNINPAQIQAQYRIQYPHLTDEQVIQATRAYILQVQSGITRKPAYDKSHYQQEMAKAKAQQQMLYPGLYQRTNNTNNRGSVQQLQQQQQNEYAQAQQIQKQYLQQAAQMQALQRAALIQNIQQQVAKSQSQKSKPSSSPPGRQEEPITLSSDDEGGANGEAIVLGGEPEAQAVERTTPSSSSSRRGRPRLDPDTDDVLG